MKTKIDEALENAEPKFPLLARNVAHDFIVLFSGKREGTVVHIKNKICPVGHHTNAWIDLDESEIWTILPPGSKIILEQE
jgi:hypothetical protein